MLLSFAVTASPEKLYQKNCASCHAPNRLGAMGPALLPGNLKRLKKNEAMDVIRQGRLATQMPGFADKLTDEQVAALVEYIYTPLPESPSWGEVEITASHKLHYRQSELSDTPVFEADPLNLFIVVELGDHHATVLDGDRFEPIHRFETHFALHGGPKYSPGGRYVYFASRDGWISKFDMYNLKTVAEVRAGINTRNLAVSADGRYVMVGNYLPHTLVLFDARDLSLIKIFDVKDKSGRSSRVSAVYTAPPRGSFVAALKDVKEVWEISYLDEPEPVATGYMHDYRYEEGYMDRGPFPLRRIVLDDYLDDFFFDQDYKHLIGAARNANNGQVVNLIVGRKIAEIDLQGLPHLGSGISWEYQGRRVLATPNLKKGEVSIIDMQNWKTIKRIKTGGPGFFMRSHKNSPYAWVDVFFGPNHDQVHIIDKATLEIVKTLKPAPGKTAAHVEFDRDGQHALLSIWDEEGYVIVYDAKTLEEVKRLPMNKPSGKYNVYNKTRYTEGTSH
ncbi:cytochrome D1 domain-containing protein [Thiohalophilus sp.]|uniref:cytochrome D1 domain-containing protein n=1 Tax=Thiohalophilus sp. TaxID=3028392 RepID=UPI002ACDB3C8|nr:cytochrome D1 domain-containing protein [Thiohalophilus sp.]MDZ7660880.1 cytochrome D1 domain-containing protein [Thiohalophilus sp.]